MIMLIRSYGGYSGYGGYGGYNDYDYSSGGSILQNLDTITTVVLIASIIAGAVIEAKEGVVMTAPEDEEKEEANVAEAAEEETNG